VKVLVSFRFVLPDTMLKIGFSYF